VVAVQARYLPRAQLVTTVCDGIAALLSRGQSPRRPVLVVRNVPFADFRQFRPVGERIKVLYHGNLTHDRQLHVAVASIRLWRPEFDLVLRGDGDPAYIEELRRLAQRNRLEHRVFFEPAVAFEQIVTAANTADIGFYSYFNHSPQIEFSLPNKFFEYIMAGLAICVSNLTEVARLTHQFGLGKLIPEHKPEAIAAAINSFTRDEIERCKRNSLRASRTLNWDCEQQRLLDAYNSLFAAPAPLEGSEPSARVIASAVSDPRLERQAR
jgi:glycosyltransferase involved in cell wall biosynthesis